MTQHQRRDDARLGELLAEVNRSRIRVRSLRGAPLTTSSRGELAKTYDELADALEAYADEATGSGVPLPYRFRDEVRLCRSLSERSF